jgi:HK97 family phage major capsid protein
MAVLINQGYIDYLAQKTITGTGTIEMFGVVTRLDATVASEIAVTTDGALGPEDALKLWNAVPERFRLRSTWLSNVSVESQLRKNGGDHGLYTVDLNSQGIGMINGRPYRTTDYMPAFDGTTGAANLAILGDFSNYVIAQRVGMSMELIPHVVDGSGLPKGQRGYYAWARVGGDAIVTNAFRLLQNT